MTTMKPQTTESLANARRERLQQAVADLAIEGIHMTDDEIAFLQGLNDEGLSDDAFMARVHEWIAQDLGLSRSAAE